MDISIADLQSILKKRFTPSTDMSEAEQWMNLTNTLLVLLRIQASKLVKEHEDDPTLFLSPLIKLGLYDEAHQCYIASLKEDVLNPSDGNGSQLHPWLTDPEGSALKHLQLHLQEMHRANQNIDGMLDEILPLLSKAYPDEKFCHDTILKEVKQG